MDDATGLRPGAALGKYRLDGLLGRGGMGEVWAAHDPDLDRKLALKVLRPAVAATEDAKARLLREGRAMAKLRHPNVITVYEATTAGGRDLIAMELIDGTSLAGWLAEARPRGAIVAALVAAGRGLAAAHAAGMVHRDFKPHNVLVDRDGRIVVTDFGLARSIEGGDAGANGGAIAPELPAAPSDAASDAAPVEAATVAGTGRRAAALATDETAVATPGASPTPTGRTTQPTADRGALHSPLTRTGAVLGTPAYMAPEQIDGTTADARSDQFAFCVTAWEALAGKRPFTGATLAELRDAIETRAVTAADRVPARLRAILTRGLAVDPLQRWPSMTALLRALERAWHRPRRVAIAVVGVAIVAAAAIPIGLMASRGAGAAGACPSFAADFAPARTDAIRATLAELGAQGAGGKRAVAYLGRWESAWHAAHTATCAKPEDPAFHARRSCLESTRGNLIELLALVHDAPPNAIANVDVVTVLPMPSGCLDRPLAVAPALPADPAVRAEIARINGQLVAARVAPQQRPGAVVAALDQLLVAARKTGHDPIVAAVLAVKGDALLGSDPASACAAHDEAANVAERAGADTLRIDAMLGQLECAQNLPDRRREIEPLIARAAGLIDRVDDRPRRALLELMRAEIRGAAGAWDEAIAGAAAARTTWLELDAPIGAARAAMIEARYRMARATGDDLAVAERELRASLDQLPPEARRAVALQRETLGELLWTRGRLDEAVAILVEFPQPAPAADLELRVEVIAADGAPADGAELVAALDPVGDPIRLLRAEIRGGVSARTDDHGAATIGVPAGAVIVARKNDQIGAIEAPTGRRDVRITLVPAAYLQVRVTQATGAAPAEPREARRSPPIGGVSIRVGAHRWNLVSPLDARGVFRLPALPGKVAISVETTTARDDSQVAVTVVDARPGSQVVELELPRPVSIRAIARPAIAGVVMALAGAHHVTTWRDLAAVQAGSHAFALAFTADPIVTADGDARPGDAVVELGAPGPGPITVCALPGADSPAWTPMSVIEPGPDATPPACVTATAVDGVVTTVVVPTAR